MTQVNYVDERDELEVIFKEIENPEIFRLSNGIFMEFGPNELSAIILPNFGQMIHMPADIINDAMLEFISFDSEALKISLNEQSINIKIDLTEIENY